MNHTHPCRTRLTLTIDETASPLTVPFTGCEAGTGRIHGGRRATRVVATLPSCTGLGRSDRAKLRATVPYPSCDGARARLTFATGRRSSPGARPPAPGGYAAAVRPVLKAACAGVVGTLVCNPGEPTQATLDAPGVSLDVEGDARFSGTLQNIPATCASPLFLVPIGSIQRPNTDPDAADGLWIAAGAERDIWN